MSESKGYMSPKDLLEHIREQTQPIVKEYDGQIFDDGLKDELIERLQNEFDYILDVWKPGTKVDIQLKTNNSTGEVEVLLFNRATGKLIR